MPLTWNFSVGASVPTPMAPSSWISSKLPLIVEVSLLL